MGEQGGAVHPGEHQVPLFPGAKGKEPGRFSEAVADDRLRLDAETPDNIAHCAAGGDLAENNRLVVAVQFFKGGAVPEQLGPELVPEPLILTILSPEYCRPAGGEFHPHPRKMVARAGEDKGDPGVPA
ncbi:hypothetical protein OR1_04157 [Geobacter sp. OR-1]|nr:hypothetical protein OR1_04157 [Geobacter sp. OR-1]